jgi:hypothetical protein
MELVFAESACLKMVVKSDVISFPPVSKGLPAITDVIRKFDQTYENVYTFCLQRPPSDARLDEFSCEWLVVMSEKETGGARVGCGSYNWCFQQKAPFLVDRLEIVIEAMQILPPERLRPVLDWSASLSYPWCSGEVVASTTPHIKEIQPIIDLIKSKQSESFAGIELADSLR